MHYSEKHLHEGKAQGQSLHEDKSTLKHIMRKCKVANYVDTETLGVQEQISSRQRSSRTTLARLHRTCTKERHNTNLEEHNPADLCTKMFGGMENVVPRKKT